MSIGQVLAYKEYEAEVYEYQVRLVGLQDRLITSLVNVMLLEHVSEPRDQDSYQRQITKLNQEKRLMEKRFALEKVVLENKIELHKKNLKFSEEKYKRQQPSSITSNKLITQHTTSFSTTPYLQKITLIKLSRVTPINPKLQENFTTSTPDTVTNLKNHTPAKASPLRGMLDNNKKSNKSSIFDDDDEDTTKNRFKKIKLSNTKPIIDDDDEEEDEKSSPVLKRLKRNNFSPLKTNNIFQI